MQKKKILVVDDERINLHLLARVLSEQYEVITVQSGLDALVEAEYFLPDLILLDVMMPELDGFQTFRLLKAHPVLSQKPVIFLTGHTDIESQYKGLDLGAVDYMLKPFNISLIRLRVRNILERESLREVIKVKQAELEAILNTIPDLMFKLDRQGTYLEIFARQPELLAQQRIDLLGRRICDMLPPEAAVQAMTAIAEAHETGTSYGMQMKLPLAGKMHWFELSVAKNESSNPDNPHFVMLSRNITDRKQAEEHLNYLAQHDNLTGLANRALFGEIVDRILGLAERTRLLFALVFIDLDKFKHINDTFGHAIGDFVLQQAANRISNTVRTTDTVGRIGGDEFVVLLPNIASRQEAIQIMERVRMVLAEPIIAQGKAFSISSSIGMAFYPDHGQTMIELTKRADDAMYEAKSSGRNRVCVFSESAMDCVVNG
ncbi:GGDEF domain-containing response regulator [Leeia oryzae]|uniref:GGDEF domain-containing response regulator n=1 Tax=Leeia oryzae TaxID=356662 RepID=UPI00037D0AB0|nr:diguanylate cyclase [Leeia oryzae]